MRTAWRPVWEEGVDLEGTWVPLEMLERLALRHPYGYRLDARGMPKPDDPEVVLAVELHGLARPARVSGWLGGVRLRPFLKALERAPQPELPS